LLYSWLDKNMMMVSIVSIHTQHSNQLLSAYCCFCFYFCLLPFCSLWGCSWHLLLHT
jgi:hypothetical protein